MTPKKQKQKKTKKKVLKNPGKIEKVWRKFKRERERKFKEVLFFYFEFESSI